MKWIGFSLYNSYVSDSGLVSSYMRTSSDCFGLRARTREAKGRACKNGANLPPAAAFSLELFLVDSLQHEKQLCQTNPDLLLILDLLLAVEFHSLIRSQ